MQMKMDGHFLRRENGRTVESECSYGQWSRQVGFVFVRMEWVISARRYRWRSCSTTGEQLWNWQNYAPLGVWKTRIAKEQPGNSTRQCTRPPISWMLARAANRRRAIIVLASVKCSFNQISSLLASMAGAPLPVKCWRARVRMCKCADYWARDGWMRMVS